jgi:electron transfer flavoprotein beta subunit
MRIIVCIKQICMTYARTGLDPEQYFFAPEDKIYRINPCDETAMELALHIKEMHDGAEIFILTLGPIIAPVELRRCLAMGADDLFQIDAEAQMEPWRKSLMLAKAIKDMAADLVLCGRESLDRQNGQVAAYVAHHLGIPFVSAIMDLEIKNKGIAEARRSAGRGMREVIQSPTPAVFSVELGYREPRLPTYEDKKKAQSMKIRRLQYTEARTPKKTITEAVFQPRPRPKRVAVPDSRLGAFDRIQQLLMGSRIEKKGSILGGNPQSQAEGIISFLDEHGFLKSKDVKRHR